MTEEFQLRLISASAVPNAIAKAEQYRRLNQGEEAESICRDILRVEPENRDAIIILALALTDQFDQGTASGGSLGVYRGEVVLEDAGWGCPAECSVGSVVIVEMHEPGVGAGPLGF